MAEMDFVENSHEIYAVLYTVQKLETSVFAVFLQNLQPYQFEPEKQNQVNSFQCGFSPDKMEEKSQPNILQNCVGNISWCQNVRNAMEGPKKLPRDFEILGWCPVGPVLPLGEKVPL